MKEHIRELLQTVPFQSFVIYMADGRTEENADRLHHLSALLMTGVEYAPDAGVASWKNDKCF